MDAIKILGSLLKNNAMGSRTGGSILENMMGGSQSSRSGDILGTLLGGKRRSSGGGGLGALGAILAAAAASKMQGNQRRGGGSGLDMIGDLLGSGGGGSNILGELLGGGGTSRSSGGGGLGDLLGGMMGGSQSSGGGGLLDSFLGGSSGGSSGGGLSSIFGATSQVDTGNGSAMLGALMGGGEEQPPPLEAQNEAELLIEAMCNSAKADGRIDEGEREAILGRLGELDQEEIDFLREQLSSPIDLDDFTRRVPDDMDEQIYAFSLMAVKLDTQEEAEYFGRLAQGLGLSGETCNAIHEQLGQPEIFA